jgi:hypothetical protein
MRLTARITRRDGDWISLLLVGGVRSNDAPDNIRRLDLYLDQDGSLQAANVTRRVGTVTTLNEMLRDFPAWLITLTKWVRYWMLEDDLDQLLGGTVDDPEDGA